MANNGLPALPIWDMTNVEDEVVLGTHGREFGQLKFQVLEIPVNTNLYLKI